MYRLKKSNKMQQYVDIYLLLNCSTCFGRPLRPSSGVHKTVVADIMKTIIYVSTSYLLKYMICVFTQH